MLSALANGRFAAYLISAALADAGYWVAYVAQGWLVLRLTNSPFWLGMIGASSYLPFLLFSLPGGTLADRFDRRMLVAVGNLGIAAIAAVAAVLVARDAITITVLAVLTFVLGTLLARSRRRSTERGSTIWSARANASASRSRSRPWSGASRARFGPAVGGLAIATVRARGGLRFLRAARCYR